MTSLQLQVKRMQSFFELDEFRQDLVKNYDVDEIEIYFARPSLWIEINSKEKLDGKSIQEIKEKLKPIINKENMEMISKKYWTKDSSLFYVEVLFNEKNANIKNTYLNIELSKEKGYKNWD